MSQILVDNWAKALVKSNFDANGTHSDSSIKISSWFGRAHSLLYATGSLLRQSSALAYSLLGLP